MCLCEKGRDLTVRHQENGLILITIDMPRINARDVYLLKGGIWYVEHKTLASWYSGASCVSDQELVSHLNSLIGVVMGEI